MNDWLTILKGCAMFCLGIVATVFFSYILDEKALLGSGGLALVVLIFMMGLIIGLESDKDGG